MARWNNFHWHYCIHCKLLFQHKGLEDEFICEDAYRKPCSACLSKKHISGLDLIIGPMYNDGWENEAEPHHNSPQHCPKCDERTTIHWLKKYIFAFGNTIIHHATVSACPNCFHEVLMGKTERKIKARNPNSRSQALSRFLQLTKEQQEELMKLAGLEVT